MFNVLQKLFRPNDGSRRAVQQQIESDTKKNVVAINRLKETIGEFLDKNDELTGRPGYNVQRRNR